MDTFEENLSKLEALMLKTKNSTTRIDTSLGEFEQAAKETTKIEILREMTALVSKDVGKVRTELQETTSELTELHQEIKHLQLNNTSIIDGKNDFISMIYNLTEPSKVWFIRICNLDGITDLYGHEITDHVIRIVKSTLTKNVSPYKVHRVSMDTYAIIGNRNLESIPALFERKSITNRQTGEHIGKVLISLQSCTFDPANDPDVQLMRMGVTKTLRIGIVNR